MSRHLYWIIMLPDGPTAFRANTADELAPTLKQLQRAQPNAQIMWFERNRLWRSPGHAREVLEQERAAARSRSGGWRPGGDHKDPRAAYQLTREQKRRRFMGKWQEQNAEKAGRGGRSPDRPAGWTPKPGGEGRPPTHDRRPDFKPGDRSGRPPGNRRPAGGSGGWTPKPGGEGRPPTHDRRPGFKPGDRSGRPPGNRRPAGGSGSWTPKPPGVRRSTDRPAGWTPKPGGEGRPPTHDGGPGFKPGDRSGRPPGNRRPAGGSGGWTPRPPAGSSDRVEKPVGHDRRPKGKAPFRRNSPPAGGRRPGPDPRRGPGPGGKGGGRKG